MRRIISAVVLLPITLTALDSDGDILPDAWEDSHSMDKNDHEDASIDFDRDRLSALEEFQLQAEGLGEGPLGKWSTELVNLDFMNRPGSSSNRKEIIDFNDRGDILVNVTSWTPVWGTAPTYYHRVWFFNGSDSTWRKLSTVAGQEPSLLVARDLNNDGIIVGQARAGTANGGVAFGFMKDLRATTFDESVAPWLDAENATVGDLTGINDFGEVIGVDAAGASFFQSPTAGTVQCPPGWVTPVFTAINNWGEVAGVEYTDYWGLGAPRHFLMTPGWHWLTDFPAFDMWLLNPEDSELADSFGADFRPTWINDWGEFTGTFWIETGNQWWNGTWYFDGSEHDATMSGTDPVVRYRNLLPEAYTHQTVRGLNNWPQILVSGSTNSVEEAPEDFEVFLVNGSQRVALSALSPVAAISDHTYENSMPVAINNRGTIIGWANSGNSLYLLTLDQDRDGDGMSNDWETFHGLDPDAPSDALGDPDGDGACNLAEYRLGTRPTSNSYRLALDSDEDGLPDAWERKMFGNLSANLAGDDDGDGLDNWEEWVIGSDPHLWDSDGDGWDDFEEFFIRGTDASNADTDGDGTPDLAEDLAGSDPKDADDRPQFPPYLRVEVKTVTNSELNPDEFVTPEIYYWAVHVPLVSAYDEGFSSALATLSEADKHSDPYEDQYPHKITRLVCDNPGTEDYYLKVLRITVIDGNGEGSPQISAETTEFKIAAGQKVSNEIETVAGEAGRVFLLPVEIKSHQDKVGPYLSPPKYSDSPLVGSATNLFSVWPNEEIILKVRIPAPFDQVGNLPPNLIKWDAPGHTIPDNTLEARMKWGLNFFDPTKNTKEITINIGGSDFKVHVKIQGVGILTELEAALSAPNAVGPMLAAREFARAFVIAAYPDGPKRDAIRHSLWCSLSVSTFPVTAGDVTLISTAHEHDNRSGKQQAFNGTMDLKNNAVGTSVNRQVNGLPDELSIIMAIEQLYSAGEMYVLEVPPGASSQSAGDSEGILIKSNGDRIHQ